MFKKVKTTKKVKRNKKPELTKEIMESAMRDLSRALNPDVVTMEQIVKLNRIIFAIALILKLSPKKLVSMYNNNKKMENFAGSFAIEYATQERDNLKKHLKTCKNHSGAEKKVLLDRADRQIKLVKEVTKKKVK